MQVRNDYELHCAARAELQESEDFGEVKVREGGLGGGYCVCVWGGA